MAHIYFEDYLECACFVRTRCFVRTCVWPRVLTRACAGGGTQRWSTYPPSFASCIKRHRKRTPSTMVRALPVPTQSARWRVHY
jgi:hypothetical protein